MNNVVLVRQGDKYGPDYTHLLRKQIKDNTEVPVNITVLGDGTDADKLLVHAWPGWWSKMELFAPWNADLRPCLFLDLDTYVLGNIDDLVSLVPPRLQMLRDFNRPETGQSAVMSIPEDTGMIWRRFTADPGGWMKKYHGGGDQAFLNHFEFDRFQDSFEGIGSYKVDNLQSDPGKFRIVCFHGKPKPHECDGWVKEVWNGESDGYQHVSVSDTG